MNATLKKLRTRTVDVSRGVRGILRLPARITQLEIDVQECRQLNKRVADLADMVVEVLLPATDRDDERFKALLNDYNKSLRP